MSQSPSSGLRSMASVTGRNARGAAAVAAVCASAPVAAVDARTRTPSERSKLMTLPPTTKALLVEPLPELPPGFRRRSGGWCCRGRPGGTGRRVRGRGALRRGIHERGELFALVGRVRQVGDADRVAAREL